MPTCVLPGDRLRCRFPRDSLRRMQYGIERKSPRFSTMSRKRYSAMGERQMLPWQINSTLIIFSYLHLSLVFLLKRLIFQGFPTFEFSFLFKVSSQIFSYFLMFFPAILVNPLVKQASLPTGFFNYSLSDILLPLHHQNLHGCKCSRLH
mgnify:CR=1 FL=1